MKISEANNAPLSSRKLLMSLRQANPSQGEFFGPPLTVNVPTSSIIASDKSVDSKRYGVSLKRGNFRKTQEDRVSINLSL